MDTGGLQPADMLQRFLYMVLLISQLLVIVKKLPLAAPAKPAVFAWGRNAVARGPKQLNNACFGILFASFENPGFHTITGYGAVDENGHPVHTGQPLATKGEIRYLDLDYLTFFNRHGSIRSFFEGPLKEPVLSIRYSNDPFSERLLVNTVAHRSGRGAGHTRRAKREYRFI
jgi:hypothetical protein